MFVILNLIQNLSVTMKERSDPSAAAEVTNIRGLVIPDLIQNLLVAGRNGQIPRLRSG